MCQRVIIMVGYPG